MKEKHSFSTLQFSLVLVLLLFTRNIFALPSGGQILHGDAVIENAGKTLKITADHDTVIQWDSFDIAENEIVEILLVDPSTHIELLVNPVKATEIFGRLLANASVSLVNSSGISIEPAGTVECAALIASAFNLTNDNEFSCQGGGSSSLVNRGTIKTNGGNIILLGQKILLTDTAVVDASGELNGGNIFIGGGKYGSDPSLPNADIVIVHRKAQIIADATLAGTGGDIVVGPIKQIPF